MTVFRKTNISSGSDDTKLVETANTASGEALLVYQTSIQGGVEIHFHVNNLTVGTYKFILIDISDVTNYKHLGGTEYAHLEREDVSVTCDINGAWVATIGFLENVTPTTSDEFVYNHWQGSKDTGNRLEHVLNSFPVGQQMNSQYLTSHSTGQNNYTSSVQVASTLSPDAPDTFPGDGDVYLSVNVTSGTVEELKINLGYHSH